MDDKNAIFSKVLKLQELAKEEVRNGDLTLAKELLIRARELFTQLNQCDDTIEEKVDKKYVS